MRFGCTRRLRREPNADLDLTQQNRPHIELKLPISDHIVGRLEEDTAGIWHRVLRPSTRGEGFVARRLLVRLALLQGPSGQMRISLAHRFSIAQSRAVSKVGERPPEAILRSTG